MKTLLTILLAVSIAFAAHSQTITTKKLGSAKYQQGYLNCSGAELKSLVMQNFASTAKGVLTPNVAVVEFFEKYPVLNRADQFKKRTKYSLINESLIERTDMNNNDEVFYLKIGKRVVKYVVPYSERVPSVLHLETAKVSN